MKEILNKCKLLLKIFQDDDKYVIIDQLEVEDNQEAITREKDISTSITKLRKCFERIYPNSKGYFQPRDQGVLQ